MIFIPRQDGDSSKDIYQTLSLTSHPRNPDAREEFLNRLNSVDTSIQLKFLKKFISWILKKHFKILLEFYIEGNMLFKSETITK